MGISALSRIFKSERFRQRAAHAGFSTPALSEIDLNGDASPLLATNMRGTFLPTRSGIGGRTRYGFSECSLSDEPKLFREFLRVVCRMSRDYGWQNHSTSVKDALTRMDSRGIPPAFLIISEASLPQYMPEGYSVEDVRKAMAVQGFIGRFENLQILLSDIPENLVVVTASPDNMGLYTRVGNSVGVLAMRVDRTVMMVVTPSGVA